MIERFELMAKLRRDLLNGILSKPLFDLVYQIMTPADWVYSRLREKIDHDK